MSDPNPYILRFPPPEQWCGLLLHYHGAWWGRRWMHGREQWYPVSPKRFHAKRHSRMAGK